MGPTDPRGTLLWLLPIAVAAAPPERPAAPVLAPEGIRVLRGDREILVPVVVPDPLGLARTLDGRGLRWAAIHFYRQARDPAALERLVALSDDPLVVFGDGLAEPMPERWPEAARSELAYATLVDAVERRDRATAERVLPRVGPPLQARARLAVGVLSVSTGKAKTGVGILEALVDDPVVGTQARLDVARTHYAAQRYAEAEDRYLRAPPSPRRDLELGWTRFMLGRELPEDLARDPLPEAAYLVALFHFQKMRYDDVHTALDALARARPPEDPELARLEASLAEVRAEAGRLAKARELWAADAREAVRREGERLERRATARRTWLVMAEADLARQARVLRFEALDAAGRHAEALALLPQVAREADEPTRSEAFWRLGLGEWEAGREDEARVAFEQVRGVRESDAQLFVGEYWFYRREWSKARQAYVRATGPHATYKLAWCDWAQGDRAGALENMRASLAVPQAADDLRRMER